MVFIIPIIAGLVALSGVGTLIWYASLSDKEKEQYDNLVLDFVKKKATGYGIQLNPSDTERSIKEKFGEKGVTNKELESIIDEARKDAKANL